MLKWIIAAAVAAACLAGPVRAQGFCGGLQGLQCPSRQYCAFTPEAHCGAADQTGTCTAQPDVCTEQYDPVCGCDGQTYGNACTAAAAGVSVVQAGECGSEPAQPAEDAKKPKREKPKDG